ncbi:hypothetical protein E2C01_075533 [Portunus trituberculatus]|uniref:Uncharacterized protein n=1 Tax=Portunus trituberculatus TaxID=210409 RepID=A0A5B7IFA5_PORTR|nr:hypothetical protein [Portunus trituberculatus]
MFFRLPALWLKKKLKNTSELTISGVVFLRECYISYTDVVSTSAARRELLYKGWFFLCECKTCLDEERAKYENSIKCGESYFLYQYA